MAQENTPDAEVEGWLTTLGIASLCQWDLLVFLYRHQISLVGAEHFSRLLGYTTESVVTAMDALASLGLVGRSRVSQGARFYQFTVPSDSPRGKAFAELLVWAGNRAGRLRLSEQLQREDQTPEEGSQAVRHAIAEARRGRRVVRPPYPKNGERKETWLKVV